MNMSLRPSKLLILIGLMVFLIFMSVGFASAQEGRLVGEPVSNSNAILHFSSPSTNSSNWTEFSSPLTNTNTNAVVFYTHNWNAGGDPSGTAVVPYPLGIWYTSSERWSLFNQDFSIPFVPDTYFNIMAQGLGGNVFLHTSQPSNISADATIIDNPLTNNQPNAILFVAANWDASSVYHNHSLGVYYSEVHDKWLIFNQDSAAMQTSVAFNVIVKEASETTFVHTKVTGDNSNDIYTPLNNPYLNNNPYAQVIVAQNYGVYNDSEVGVWYSDTDGIWYIYNEDLTLIPNGTRFNVHVISNNGAARNVLLNGGFEVPGESPAQAINWTSKDKAKRKCSDLAAAKDVSYAGECAMLIKGKPGLSSGIKQVGAMDSSSARFVGHFTGKNIFGGLKAVAKLTLNNGTDVKLILDPTQLNSGTYTLDLSEQLLIPADIVAYKVQVKLDAPSGKLLVDELYLSSTLAIRSEELLPLPAIGGAVSGGPGAGQPAAAQTVIAGIPGQ